MTELTPLLGLLFDDASITLDDKPLLPQAIRRNGQEEAVDRLNGKCKISLGSVYAHAIVRPPIA